MGGWGRAWALVLERGLGLVYEKGGEGSKRVIWGRPKQGQKICFTLKKKTDRVAVRRMFQNLGHVGAPALELEGRAQGGHVPR